MKKQSRVRRTKVTWNSEYLQKISKEVAEEGANQEASGGPNIARQSVKFLWLGVSLMCSQNSKKASVSGIVIGIKFTPGPPDKCVHTLWVLPSDQEADIEQVLIWKRLGCWENISPGGSQP